MQLKKNKRTDVGYPLDSKTYLNGTIEEEARVTRVTWPEHDGSSSQCSGGFPRHVGPRVVPIDLVHRPQRIHVLGPLPAIVVRERVAHLDENHARHRRSLQQVVRRPPDGLQGVPELRPHVPPEVYNAPRQQRRRERHWEPELHVVPRVVVAPCQVYLFERE